MFDENFNESNDVNQQAKLLVQHITKSCDAARTKKKHTARRKPEYWWNSEVEIMRNDCYKARRLKQRRIECGECTFSRNNVASSKINKTEQNFSKFYTTKLMRTPGAKHINS